jgi:hypothetical protein
MDCIAVSAPAEAVVSSIPSYQTVERTEAVTIEAQGIAVIQQGSGSGSATSTVELTAGEAISALRAVAVKDGKAYTASSADASYPVLGIAKTSADSGSSITVQTDGILDDPSFEYSQPLYIDSIGRLTEQAPTSGIAQQVATPAGAGRISIELQQPLYL